MKSEPSVEKRSSTTAHSTNQEMIELLMQKKKPLLLKAFVNLIGSRQKCVCLTL